MQVRPGLGDSAGGFALHVKHEKPAAKTDPQRIKTELAKC
jgi:hypothetical protein